jgi:mannose-6-phosphate isomerase-like protein (cupin superfamily)
MSHNNSIVKKPWGYEYLAYENDDVGLWFLNIKKDQSTSMHCHPTKTTGLVILDGIAEVSFLSDKRILQGLDKAMIRRGLFHQTKALSDSVLLLEIETPKDKHDLVRLSDKYGRQSKPYEDDSFEYPKQSDCLWIEEPELNQSYVYEFGNCLLTVETISNIDMIDSKKDTDLFMFLKGGLVRNIDGRNHLVTIPGDVGFANIVKQVSSQLDGVAENTIILTIQKYDK